jgi:hypothetical protein
MKTLIENTYWVKIYVSGPLNVIEQSCRKECLLGGLCVTVDPTKFIYVGGEELGAVVGLINYPRFPITAELLIERARLLATRILEDACQHSILIMTPDKSEWITKRDQ